MSTAVPSAVNYWPQSKCARAFWSQHEVRPYQKLLRDTAAWMDPAPGERWLDLGCGCGQLTQALWARGGGRLAEVVGQDCAAVNEQAYARLRVTLRPEPPPGALRFVTADFSAGLPHWGDGQFNGIVSGLAIQYAEHYSAERQCWTTDAYDHLLREMARVLRPGGRLVFSVNVPEPAWGKVALQSLGNIFRSPRPARFLKNSWRMLRYGAWLTREARRGRFHYLPADVITEKLAAAGFTAIEHRLTYAGQAYLFRCRKAGS